MQFMAILICSKLFSVMTYIPEKGTNGTLFVITVLLSFVIFGLLMIPSAAFYNKNNGEGILTFAGSKSRILAVLISIFYLIISLAAVIKVMGDISFYLRYCFSETYAPWTIIIVIAAAAFYISQLHIDTLARSSGVVAVTAVVGLGLVLLGFQHHIDFKDLNVAVESPAAEIAYDIPRVFANAYELAALVILQNCLKNKPYKTLYSYLTVKTVIIVITVLSVTLVLGEYTHLSKLPFFSLSAFSQTKLFEHFEALFMLFWTLCAIIKITLFTICADSCLAQIIPSYKRHSIGKASVLTLCAAVTIPLVMYEKWEELKFINLQAVLIFIGIFVVPLIMLMFRKRKSE